MISKKEIYDIALEYGADDVGIANVDFMNSYKDILKNRKFLSFENKNIRAKLDPLYHFEDSKSAVVIIKSYKLYLNRLENGKLKVASSMEKDYHIVIREILKKIQSTLLEHDINSRVICDLEGLLDREMAYRAGLGFFGKNGFIIHKEYGTAFNIGYLLIDKYYESENTIKSLCGSCNRCIKSCPKGALNEMDFTKCLSYLTQSKNELNQSLKSYVYGCDICQLSCPFNKIEKYNEAFIIDESVAELSNRELKNKYKERDFMWIGPSRIKRNIKWNKKGESMKFLKDKVQELKKDGVYRVLPVFDSANKSEIVLNGKKVINLSSNNYLGFANHPEIKKAAIEAVEKYGVGSGAVRTIVGNMDIHEELERKLEEFKKEEAVMIYQSGFNCNAGTIQAVTDKGDLIISDSLNHASIIDGVKLSRADKAIFKHSDMDDLERVLKETKGKYNQTLIITDGVFSMDGDIAKLPEIVKLAKQYGALTYVDDAHGSGVLGQNGRGTVDHFNLHGEVDFIIGTLSKALGVVGGYVASKKEVKEWLSHRGRPILFSTSLPPAAVGALIKAIDLLSNSSEYTDKLWENSRFFKKGLKELGFDIGNSETPITPVIIGEEKKAMDFSKALLDNGVFVSAIVFPTVALNTARVRCMVTAEHTKEELQKAIDIFEKVAKEMEII